MPPLSKDGSKISVLVSLKTFDGGGSVAPVRRHTHSHSNRNSAITITGGTTLTAIFFSVGSTRAVHGGRRGVIAMTLVCGSVAEIAAAPAPAGTSAASSSVFRTGPLTPP